MATYAWKRYEVEKEYSAFIHHNVRYEPEGDWDAVNGYPSYRIVDGNFYLQGYPRNVRKFSVGEYVYTPYTDDYTYKNYYIEDIEEAGLGPFLKIGMFSTRNVNERSVITGAYREDTLWVKSKDVKGLYLDQVVSTSQATYPQNGVLGDYWYEFIGKISDVKFKSLREHDIMRTSITMGGGGTAHEVTPRIKLEGKVYTL